MYRWTDGSEYNGEWVRNNPTPTRPNQNTTPFPLALLCRKTRPMSAYSKWLLGSAQRSDTLHICTRRFAARCRDVGRWYGHSVNDMMESGWTGKNMGGRCSPGQTVPSSMECGETAVDMGSGFSARRTTTSRIFLRASRSRHPSRAEKLPPSNAPDMSLGDVSADYQVVFIVRRRAYIVVRSESDDAVIEKPTKEFRLSLEEARHDQRRKSSEYHECSAFMEEHGSIMMLQVGRRHAAFPTNIPLKLHTYLEGVYKQVSTSVISNNLVRRCWLAERGFRLRAHAVWPPAVGQEFAYGRFLREEPTDLEFSRIYKPPTILGKKTPSKGHVLFKPLRFRHQERNTQNKLGETVYKGHRSYDLMLNLQVWQGPLDPSGTLNAALERNPKDLKNALGF
eukprot:4776406-Pyramimonas_sp.AAC.2